MLPSSPDNSAAPGPKAAANRAWRLVAHVVLWALAFPAIGLGIALLEQSSPDAPLAWWLVPALWALMLCWPVWIYIAHAPRPPTPAGRARWLAGYLAAIVVVGYGALRLAVFAVAHLVGL